MLLPKQELNWGKKKEKMNGLWDNEIKVSPRIVNKLRIWKNKYNELNHHCQQVTKHIETPRHLQQKKKKPKKCKLATQWRPMTKGSSFGDFFSLYNPRHLHLQTSRQHDAFDATKL